MYDNPETVNKGLKKLMLLINKFFTLRNVTINFFPCELGFDSQNHLLVAMMFRCI